VHIVRVDQATKTIKVTVHKAEASKLGIVLSNLDDGRHVVCTEIQETGALHGKGLMHVGDVILSVSAVVPPSTKPTTLEATHHRSVGGLLQSAVGEIHFEVERPEPAIPTRILHSAFLSKRSPNVIFGKSVWQRRWFELASSHLSYWELSERSDDSAKSQSFLGTQRGMIALMDVAGVRVDRADPRHFDILMKNKRMFQLAVPTAEERGPWCDALKQGFVDALAADAAGVSLEPPATPDAPPAPPAPQDELEQSMRDEGDEQADLEGADKPPTLDPSASSVSDTGRSRGLSLTI